MIKLSPLRQMETEFPSTLALDGTADCRRDHSKAFVDEGTSTDAPVLWPK